MPRKIDAQFKITPACIIVLLISWIVVGFRYFTYFDFNADSMLHLVASTAFPFFISLFIGWITWRLNGSNDVANIVFGVLIILLSLGSCRNMKREHEITQHNQEQKKIQSEQEDRGNELLTTIKTHLRELQQGNTKARNLNERIQWMKLHTEGAISSLHEISRLVPEQQRSELEVLETFLQESFDRHTAYIVPTQQVISMNTEILAVAIENGEADQMKKLVQNALDQTFALDTFYRNRIPELFELLKASAERPPHGNSRNEIFPEGDHTFAFHLLKQTQQRHSQLQPVLAQIVSCQVKHGASLLKLIDLLNNHHDSWKYNGTRVLFSDQEVLQQHDDLIKVMNENATNLHKLQRQL